MLQIDIKYILLTAIFVWLLCSVFYSRGKKIGGKKGYEQGKKEVIGEMRDMAYWFTSTNIPVYNTLLVLARNIDKFIWWDKFQFRKSINDLDKTKVTDLDVEKLTEYFGDGKL